MTRDHDRYRVRLTTLAADEPIASVLTGVADRLQWPARLSWRRLYGRFDPAASPYAVLVVQSCDRDVERVARVEAFDREPARSQGQAVWWRDRDLGALCVTPLQADPDLPALGRILATERATVVSYRPNRRCVVRTVRDGRPLFGRIYRDGGVQARHRRAEQVWRASMARALTFTAARPVTWSSADRARWEVELAGYPVRPRLAGREGGPIVRRMAAALASLAASDLSFAHRFDAAAQMCRSAKIAIALQRRMPALSTAVDTLLQEIAALHARAHTTGGHPIHRRPRLDQWLATSDGVALLGCDRVAFGDRELDAAIVMSDLDALAAPGTAELAEAFLDAYEVAQRGLVRPLLNAYRAHQQLERAWRAALALRPDADAQARELLRARPWTVGRPATRFRHAGGTLVPDRNSTRA